MKKSADQLVRLRWRALMLICAPALLLTACSHGGDASNTPPPIEVQTATPVQKTFYTKIAAFGQLAADSRNALSLSLPQAGLVVATTVLAGQRVQRGEPLLELQTDPAARSAYLQAQSAVAIARDDLSRTEHLHAEKLATNVQLDAARKALADAQATLSAQTRLGGGAAVATLRAPADGVVTALDVQRGQRVATGTRLLEFTPRAALVAQLGIEPGAASGIHAGMPATLYPVYAARGAKPVMATVAMAGAAINPATHLVDVIATLDQTSGLPAGAALSATIQTAQFTAWAVPRDALQNDSQGTYVFQIEHGKAKRVDVRVLAPDGSPVGIAGPLDADAPVITLGSYEVASGDAVTAVPIHATKTPGTAAR